MTPARSRAAMRCRNWSRSKGPAIGPVSRQILPRSIPYGGGRCGTVSSPNHPKELPMTRSVADKRAAFRALHQQGCFVLPNPWDVGSARLLQHMGFAALASSSAGFAWTMGRPDYAVTRDDVLQHLTMLCAAVDLPVNADFESGFASAPDELAG